MQAEERRGENYNGDDKNMRK